jgi:hypothetical protein
MFYVNIDNTARFFLDPSNSKFSQGKKVVAWTSTLLAGIATLGFVQAASALWRSCRQVHEKNETQDKISRLCHKIFCCPQTSEPLIPQSSRLQNPPTIDEGPFSCSNLSAFVTAIKYARTRTFMVNQTNYRVQYDSGKQTICIQEMGKRAKIEIEITSGGSISSLRINDVLQTENPTEIPEIWALITTACFKQALESSSEYSTDTFNGNPIRIQIVRRGLKEVPEYHLLTFIEMLKKSIERYSDPAMKVYFWSDIHRASDLGGPSRDYLDDLAEGIMMSPAQNFILLHGLAIPQAKQNVTQSQLALLDREESSIYEALGALMMYCFHSQSDNISCDTTRLLGHHFDGTIFKGALTLTAQEIETPFDKLTPVTLLKLSQAVLKEKQDSGQNVAHLQQWFSILNECNNLSNRKLAEAAQTLAVAGALPQKFQKPQQDDTPDMDAIKANHSEFKNCFQHFVFSQESSFGQIGKMLAPIHAIAKGMKSICNPGCFRDAADNDHWNTHIQHIDYQAFREKVQGSLDPSMIAEQIQPLSRFTEILKKVKWLKEWIKEEATQEELRAFLKFSTGTSALLKGKTIKIMSQTYSENDCAYYPIPKAHTCTLQLQLAPEPSQYGSYNDHTKEAFIKALKDLAFNVTGYQIT